MLSQKAILVHLSMSQWKGRKTDRRATTTVESTFSTDRKVGNFTKKLLPGASELDRIDAATQSMRKWVSSQTVPWLSDGTRMLSSKNYLDFVTEFRERKNAFESAVNDFISVYPKLRDSAKHKLGSLFNELDYPSEIRLRDAFQCEVSFFPVPDVSDFRTEILDSEKDDFLRKMREVESRATRECFDRLREVVQKAAETLQKPDAIFRDSLIQNITDLCTLLPKLNVTDDPQLEAARREVESLTSKISLETCRTNPNERADTAKKLAEIDSLMGAFMGAGKE